MKQATDDMVRAIISGGGLSIQGFQLSLKGGKFPDRRQNMPITLNAVTRDGTTTISCEVMSIDPGQVKLAIDKIFQDINSSIHLPESAYKNQVRLNTEYRCHPCQIYRA